MINLGVLASGRGSNLEAIIAACGRPYFPARVAVVISDKADARALQVAAEADIPTYHVPHPSRTAFAIGAGWPLIKEHVDLVILAGFMRILQRGFVMRWSGRMINIHPSLLPDFPGLHPQRQALAAGRHTTGCTVHWVDPEVDAGPIIAQAVVPIEDGDDEEILSARIRQAEHHLYPLVINQIARNLIGKPPIT